MKGQLHQGIEEKYGSIMQCVIRVEWVEDGSGD